MPLPKDITELFTVAASLLPVGELVQDDFFTLAESVGALEIMDPKMDSGLLEEGEALGPDYNFARKITAAQLIGLMDRLLSLEAAWHQGNSLAQTVFTCLYIDNLLWPSPTTLQEAAFKFPHLQHSDDDPVLLILRAFCCGLLKTCHFIHDQITHAQYYEEEDFSAHLFSRTLLDVIPVEEILQLLFQSQQAIEKLDDSGEDVRQALRDRLSFRTYFLEAVSSKAVSSTDSFCTSFAFSAEALQRVRDSCSLGVPLPEAFSAKVQRKLDSSTPPRPIVELSLSDTFEDLIALCRDANEAAGILESATPGTVLNFELAYMSKPKQPCLYVRCLLQSMIQNENLFLGKFTTRDFIFEDLSRNVLGASILIDPANDAAEAPQSNSFQIAQNMGQFATSAASNFTELAKCLCMNRARTRRLLAHVLSAWDNLQFEAEDIDVRLQAHTDEVPLVDRLSASQEVLWSYPLSSWTYVYKIRQMEWIVQLGFELSVYQADELPAMFWFLRYLADVRYQHLARITAFIRRAYGFLEKSNEDQAPKFALAIDTLDFFMTEARAIVSFSESLSHLYKALLILELIPALTKAYGDNKLRHSLRMKPFLPISLPPVPSESELEIAIETGIELLSVEEGGDKAEMSNFNKAVSLLKMAEGSIHAAKTEWNATAGYSTAATQRGSCEQMWSSKVKDVSRSMIAAGIAISAMQSALAKTKSAGQDDLRNTVEITIRDRGYHEWWPVPTIKAR